MAYNPEKDAYQPLSRPYKEALKKLARRQHRTDRQTLEMIIENACRAQGILVAPIEKQG